ncbi:4Fe-4S dicluster domain-containing protein [Clostridium isatidis]|uniref:RnfABCDGE type electron transport complex subunit C n=1 Tax=Clostridium isatidis TaxID=182773 RepID=A0A343JBX7_9CLOT|nr:4Fe-4S dicluster domain-containing protein [Clostridium isatidis]ASW43035.1 RnfABCDGE type electron transport complex subunit C [Clostridium isatidis]
MFFDFFSNRLSSNKLFKIKEDSIKKLITETNSDKNESKKFIEKLNTYFEGNQNNKIIIKAFSFQPNINGYGIILRSRKEDFIKGLEKIKSIGEVKFVVDGNDKNLEKDLGEFGEVIKLPSKTDLYKDKISSIIYGDKKDVLIFDLIEVIQIGQAAVSKEIEILFTVYGSSIQGGTVVSVNENATYRQVYEGLNGTISKLKKVINGGNFNGIAIYDLDEKISLNTKGILFLSDNDIDIGESAPCIRCGECLKVCPENLNPAKLLELHKIKEDDELIKFGLEKCIECGLCSYVCPSKIEVAQTMKTAKFLINKKSK